MYILQRLIITVVKCIYNNCYQQQSYFQNTPNMGQIFKYDCCWYSVFNVFLFIKRGIPATHVINSLVVVGIPFTLVFIVIG